MKSEIYCIVYLNTGKIFLLMISVNLVLHDLRVIKKRTMIFICLIFHSNINVAVWKLFREIYLTFNLLACVETISYFYESTLPLLRRFKSYYFPYPYYDSARLSSSPSSFWRIFRASLNLSSFRESISFLFRFTRSLRDYGLLLSRLNNEPEFFILFIILLLYRWMWQKISWLSSWIF